MMKQLFCFFLLFVTLLSYSQSDNISGIPIPMKNGKVFYEKEYSVTSHATKAELFLKAKGWLADNFKDLEEPLVADKTTGTMTFHGLFKIVVSTSGNYYWVKPVISIAVEDGKYTFRAYDYYEKPIEKGISNEYSKIEYRWRDFRKGKPWSTEDEALFKGIDANSLTLMNSLEKKMQD